MITEFSINGFKSLQNFKISFNRGLNVLIGPNGAGKTNICQSLGLVAAAANESIPRYLLSLGGIKSSLPLYCSSNPEQPIANKIEVSSKGITTTETGSQSAVLKYEYSFTIVYEREYLHISEEHFHLYKKSKHKRFNTILDASRSKDKKLSIRIKNKNEIGGYQKQFIGNRRKLAFILDRHVSTCLPILGVLFYYCHVVREDLRFSRAWNIDPILARYNSDVLESKKMLPDGRRLSNAIYEIKNTKSDKVDQINDFLSKIIPNFKKFDTSTSSEGNRTFSIVDNDDVICPANCLSDGTIKILALLIGILGEEQSTSIIEEPENYLHPWASQVLIEFLREYFNDGTCILTTHSETILNSIKPKEVIIVEQTQGKTTNQRLYNKKELIESISSTGFGVGYHYIAGSLGGVPE